MSRKIDKNIKRKVENILDKYLFWKLRLETIGVQTLSAYNINSTQNYLVRSIVEDTAMQNEYIRKKVRLVEGVYNLLTGKEQEVIKLKYFQKNDRECVIDKMNISSRTFYNLRDSAFLKFALGLGLLV